VDEGSFNPSCGKVARRVGEAHILQAQAHGPNDKESHVQHL